MLGDDIDTPFALALRRPVVPEIFGFDPRVQFVHEDDVVDALMYATTNDVPGVYNVAGDGNLPWSEVCAIVGKRRLPLPFVLTNLAAEPFRLLRLWDLPPEALQLLRYGRSIDNRRYKRAGLPLLVHDRGHRRGVRARACGSRRRSATSTRRIATSAKSRTSSATPPPCVRPRSS